MYPFRIKNLNSKFPSLRTVGTLDSTMSLSVLCEIGRDRSRFSYIQSIVVYILCGYLDACVSHEMRKVQLVLRLGIAGTCFPQHVVLLLNLPLALYRHPEKFMLHVARHVLTGARSDGGTFLCKVARLFTRRTSNCGSLGGQRLPLSRFFQPGW